MVENGDFVNDNNKIEMAMMTMMMIVSKVRLQVIIRSYDDDGDDDDDGIEGAHTSARRRPQSGRVRRTGQHLVNI